MSKEDAEDEIHRKFLEGNKNLKSKVIIIERDLMDFENPSDFQEVIRRIEE